MKILGIDEAGRGPVIGPMVIAYAMTDEEGIGNLERMGIKDSKLIAPGRREELFEILTEADYLEYDIIIVEPEEIDKTVDSDDSNLNWLEADKSIMLINIAEPDKAILDCPSNNINAYSNYIKEKISNKLKKKPEIAAEHKADAKYVIVGAASIIAKVTRDRMIRELKKKLNTDIGSGYPSDPITVDFLRKNYDNPELQKHIRKSWESYRRIVSDNKQKRLGEF